MPFCTISAQLFGFNLTWSKEDFSGYTIDYKVGSNPLSKTTFVYCKGGANNVNRKSLVQEYSETAGGYPVNYVNKEQKQITITVKCQEISTDKVKKSLRFYA